ncbi:MAG: methyltransferase FkbM [Hymenobacter sp.]|nr:methyltransferase FkbM [Hymenobacter sp.]
MMRPFLKYLRSISPLNTFIRSTLRSIPGIIHRLESHWRIFGQVTINFEGQPLTFYTAGDDDIVDTLYYQKNYLESNEIHLFSHFAKRAKIIIDVGANTGVYTLVSAIANPKATIYAFEPNPVNHTRLLQNIKLNGLSNVRVEQQAVGNADTPIVFNVPADARISYTSSVLADFSHATHQGKLQWKEITVPQVTLDAYTANHSTTVDLLKIDVENYEMSLFDGARQFFSRHSPVVLCEIFLDEERLHYFQQFLRTYQYTAYAVLNDGILRLDDNLEKGVVTNNFLFAPRKTGNVFTPYLQMDKLCQEIFGATPELPK